MHRINVPRANSNDGNCLLLEWLYENGQEVQAGNVLAYLETSKATVDVLSPGTGILHRLGEPGEVYAPGSCRGCTGTGDETWSYGSPTPFYWEEASEKSRCYGSAQPPGA